MTDGMLARFREIVGASGVERDPAGLPRVVPDSTEAMARLFALAHARSWRARIEGQGTWLSSDAPADFAVSTRGLDRVVSVSPADLVATVDAGVAIGTLRRRSPTTACGSPSIHRAGPSAASAPSSRPVPPGPCGRASDRSATTCSA
jgi:hypothetical protein